MVRANLSVIPPDYAEWIAELKHRIAGARQRAVLAANEEQIRLYHDIGREILERQERQGWGAKVIDRLSSELREAFPDMRGFSASNLKYMRFFAQQCPELRIGQQSADQLPWFHIAAQPLGDAEYRLLRALPEPLGDRLLTIEEIKAGSSGEPGVDEWACRGRSDIRRTHLDAAPAQEYNSYDSGYDGCAVRGGGDA